MILQNNSFNNLLVNYPIQEFDLSNANHLNQLSTLSINSIANNGGVLPAIPPFETHPYTVQLECSPEITGLMIGTFPPISYLCDSLGISALNYLNQAITAPDFSYFHGNYSSLWKHAPDNLGFGFIAGQPRNNQPQLLQANLNACGIVYTDIIKYCQRKLDNNRYTASDSKLNNIVINNDVYNYLFNCKCINRLYFTNSNFYNQSTKIFKANGSFNLTSRDSFTLFLKGAQDLGCTIEINIPNFQNWVNINEGQNKVNVILINHLLTNKVLINLRLTKNQITKTFQVCSTVSPAALNRGMARVNSCVKNYVLLNGIQIKDGPKELLKKVLLEFFNDNLITLAPINV